MKDLEKNKNILLEIITEITDEAEETLKAESKEDYESGQLLAYATALSIIKGALGGYDLEKYKLNYDIDKKYLLSI